MPKKMAQDVARQVKQIAEETVEEAAKQPGGVVDEVFDQLITRASQDSGDSKAAASVQPPDQNFLKQKEKTDKLKSAKEIRKLKQELKIEMVKYRQTREEQLRQRREQQEVEEKARKEKEEEVFRGAPPGRQPKGLMAGLRSRKRSSQPELAGGRRSG